MYANNHSPIPVTTPTPHCHNNVEKYARLSRRVFAVAPLVLAHVYVNLNAGNGAHKVDVAFGTSMPSNSEDQTMNLTIDSPDYRHLFGVAYRILGSVHDAEDAIQEGAVRWHSLSPQDRTLIREPLAWMTRVVSRVCLDQLGSARSRREAYAGIWLPEPVPGSVGPTNLTSRPQDPADAVTLDESVSLALLRTMESLTPGERVALILHDVFGLPFAEIADIVGRTPHACRQLASTARRRIRSGPRFQLDDAQRQQTVSAFNRACSIGDLEELVAVLAPEVVIRSDGGGMANVARVPITGATRVAQFLLGIVRVREAHGEHMIVRETLVNNHTGLEISIGDHVMAIMDLAVVDDRVTEIAIIMSPDKLGAWTNSPKRT